MLQDKTNYYTNLESSTVSELMLRYLHLEKVDYVFGVPGQGIVWPIYQLAYSEAGQQTKPDQNGINYIIARHDGGAAFMADGYARVSGKLGVCLVTSGPGATNAATGVMCAQVDSSSVLVITGEIQEKDFGKGGFQEGADAGVDVLSMFRQVCAYSERVTGPENFQTLFEQALRISRAQPKRAVHLNIPLDVAGATREVKHFPRSRFNYRCTANGGDEEGCRRALKLLMKAKRPLILLGSGCREALVAPPVTARDATERYWEERQERESRRLLKDFTKYVVERHGIPVMTSPRAKGIFPEGHPLSLRNFGMSACAWPEYYLRQSELEPQQPRYDLLLVMGTSLKQWTTNKWNEMLVPNGPIIQVDLNPDVIARGFPIELGVVANARTFMRQLITLCRRHEPRAGARETRALVESIKQQHSPFDKPQERRSNAVPLRPQRVMAELQKVLDSKDILKRGGANLFLDVGNNMGWCWHELEINPPNQIWANVGMGSMGWGHGAVIGGKLAAPDKPAILVSGDGGFLMNGNELSTATQYKLGTVYIILEDNNLLMVSQGIAGFKKNPNDPGSVLQPPKGYSWSQFYELGNANLVEHARALGADAYEVSKPGELAARLPGLIKAADEKKRPQVVVVKIDPTQAPPYPMPVLKRAGLRPAGSIHR